MNEQRVERRPRWLLWVAGAAFIALLSALVVLFEEPATPIEEIYRPTRSGIEQVILRRVRHNKGTRLMEFYGGWYTVAGEAHRMEFALDPGTYHVGDTVWVLYDPAKPESNIVYDSRTGAMHLDNADLSNVLLDFDGLKRHMDSVERVWRGER